MVEKELQHKLGEYLKQWFYVQYEVYSITNEKRIDIVLVHKDNLEGFINPIGIEIKIDEKKRGKDLANWIKQASRYSELKFKGFGSLLIFTYPQISGKYLEEGYEMSKHNLDDKCSAHHNVSTFLGQFNIGELQRYHFNNVEYLKFVFKGRDIWDSRKNNFRNDFYTLAWNQLK